MRVLTKHCEICGRKIEKGQDIARYGKHFDSEEHAEQYAKRNQENQAPASEHNHPRCNTS